MRNTLNALDRSKVREIVFSLLRQLFVRFFFHFRFFVYRPYTSAVSSAVIFSSLVQHNTTGQHKGKRPWLSYTISYFSILEILYVCTNLHFWNHHVPWIFSSETILIITWRKWKLLVLFLSIMRFCQILVITLKSSSLQWKSTTQKYHHWSSNLS